MDTNSPDIQMVCFSLGECLFAVDIMRIREIIDPRKFSALSGGSKLLDGVMSFRGDVIPVMNLRKRFAMPEAADCTTCKLMIVSLARQTLALVVDNVMEIITVPVGDITPPQDTMHANVLEHLLGICHSDDSVFMILDIDSLKVFS